METMQDIVNQEWIEQRFNRKLIDGHIRDAIGASPVLMDKVAEGAALLKTFLEGQYYSSKMTRLVQLQGMDLAKLVLDVFVAIAYFRKEELLASVAAQLASKLGMDDKVAAITTLAEIIAVLSATDVFDITKPDEQASLKVISCITLDEELLKFMARSRFLPPMVCEPLELLSNYDSGYLTHKDGLVLGKGNMHAGDICLDVLNLTNQVPLRLALDYIGTVEEEMGEVSMASMKAKALKEKGVVITDAMALRRVQEYVDNWNQFKVQSYETYTLLATHGNKFHLTHKPDMRGRLYSQGYHCNTEGSGFKKASVELWGEEIIEGMPSRS